MPRSSGGWEDPHFPGEVFRREGEPHLQFDLCVAPFHLRIVGSNPLRRLGFIRESLVKTNYYYYAVDGDFLGW